MGQWNPPGPLSTVQTTQQSEASENLKETSVVSADTTTMKLTEAFEAWRGSIFVNDQPNNVIILTQDVTMPNIIRGLINTNFEDFDFR